MVPWCGRGPPTPRAWAGDVVGCATACSRQMHRNVGSAFANRQRVGGDLAANRCGTAAGWVLGAFPCVWLWSPQLLLSWHAPHSGAAGVGRQAQWHAKQGPPWVFADLAPRGCLQAGSPLGSLPVGAAQRACVPHGPVGLLGRDRDTHGGGGADAGGQRNEPIDQALGG